MADLPLLIFPKAKPLSLPPEKGRSFSGPHLPSLQRQTERMQPQFDTIQQQFRKAEISLSDLGLEPEIVLVIEIVGTIDDFKKAIEKTEGLEWLAEWELEDIAPDEDFYDYKQEDKQKVRSDKTLSGNLFLSMSNERGMEQFFNLWNHWKQEKPIPHGQGKWENLFEQIKTLRRWGIEDQIRNSGMLDHWKENLTDENIFRIELFYPGDPKKRKSNEEKIREQIEELGGQILNTFIDIPEIRFHAAQIKMDKAGVESLIKEIESDQTKIQLLQLPSIMYYRPVGQAVGDMPEALGQELDLSGSSEKNVSEEPVAALLDGAPFEQHSLLKDRVKIDDPDDFLSEYQPGEKKHGTTMASLLIYGELDAKESPLESQIYCRPILQPDPATQNRQESYPESLLIEDLIHRSVRRMFEGEGDVPPQAPSVKVINLSIGDANRPFFHSLSPLARLLDHLAHKYKVLFVISMGNFTGDMELKINENDFQKLSDEEKVKKIILHIVDSDLKKRKLISPAESLNGLSVGALHSDSSVWKQAGNRVDILPNSKLPSPINCLGHGFRRSVKPDILMPGGRQLYTRPISKEPFKISETNSEPGQKVAYEGKAEAKKNDSCYTRGTSNAAALASRATVHIHKMLGNLEHDIPDEYQALLMKALLVHGASQNTMFEVIKDVLKNKKKSSNFKSLASRFLGYGSVDIERVLSCTEKRATVIGYGKLNEKRKHEYQFPLPPQLSNEKAWRRLTITLAWFTPVNPAHRNFREAKLEFIPPSKTDHLLLQRKNFDHNQVKRGTLQHEILESEKVSPYQEGESLLIPIQCKPDATERLDEEISYALAVTLEVKEEVDIPIYQEVKNRIALEVSVQSEEKIGI